MLMLIGRTWRVSRAAGVRGLATSSTLSPYLHETRIPTYHFQDSLPKLKVPALEATLDKYRVCAEPMVSADEYAQTLKAVAEFQEDPNQGPALQKELVALDKTKYSSFYNEMWFDMYLESRAPLPLNYNPQLTFKDETNPSKNEQAIRTANLVASSLRFYRTLLDEKLKPDIFHTEPKRSMTSTYETVCSLLPRQVAFYGSYYFGAYPLDMSQYKNLFSSTRIPNEGKDELRKFTPEKSKHVVVQKGPAIYVVKVLNDDMSIVDVATLERAIRAILNDSKGSSQAPVGILTTTERDTWANARAKLEQSSVNKSNLEAIDSALFAICLDDEKPTSYEDISTTMLHGNGRNRWFDKSFQLIVAGNGTSAVNFEHAWGDGVAVLRYFNEVYADSTKVEARNAVNDDIPEVSTSSDSIGVPRLLQFELDAESSALIDKSEKDFDQVISSYEIGTFETKDFSKKLLKDLGIGGDGFMQMGFQLAHRRMNGFTPATYESASTSAFKHGRTETIRPATPEAAAFAKAFCDSSVPDGQRAALLKTAIKRHGAITKDALMGKGIDRHLFALRTLAERQGGRMPSIYEDKAYKVMNHIILSTSTLASDALYAGGFGPVNNDCFALAYGLADDGARTAVATYKTGSQEFADHLSKAYEDMLDVLRKDQKEKL